MTRLIPRATRASALLRFFPSTFGVTSVPHGNGVSRQTPGGGTSTTAVFLRLLWERCGNFPHGSGATPGDVFVMSGIRAADDAQEPGVHAFGHPHAGLGIGAKSVIFQRCHAVLLNPCLTNTVTRLCLAATNGNAGSAFLCRRPDTTGGKAPRSTALYRIPKHEFHCVGSQRAGARGDRSGFWNFFVFFGGQLFRAHFRRKGNAFPLDPFPPPPPPPPPPFRPSVCSPPPPLPPPPFLFSSLFLLFLLSSLLLFSPHLFLLPPVV